MHSVSKYLFFIWSLWLRPLPIYSILFQHPGLPVDGKYCILEPWKPANKLNWRSQILPKLKKLQHLSKKRYDQRHITKKGIRLLLLRVLNLATCVSVECFEFELQLLFHLLAVNITHCINFTFIFSHFADDFIQSNLQLANTLSNSS